MRLVTIVAASTIFATTAQADRLNDILAASAAKPTNSAIVQGLTNAYTWTQWNMSTVEEAKRLAVSNCQKTVTDGCQIVAVNGKFNGRERRTFAIPASIVVFDHVSGSKQTMSGVLRRTNADAEVSGFQLQTVAGKTLCSGSATYAGKSWLGVPQFSASGNCFGQKASQTAGGDQKTIRWDYGGSYIEITLRL
jgi:hypothetical protein